MSLPPPVAIVGLGHIGRIHLQSYRALRALGLVSRIYAQDTDLSRMDAFAGDGDIHVLHPGQPLPGDVKAVSVCVPPQHHSELTLPLLRRGLAVLVEKPLTPTAREARMLIETARLHGASLFVGHSERFNRAVRAALPALGALEDGIQRIEAARCSQRSPRHEGIDIILDLMIHDIDLMLALTGDTPVEIDAVGAALHGPRLDAVVAQLRLSRGGSVHLTARRFAVHPTRHFTLCHGQGSTQLDLLAGCSHHHHRDVADLPTRLMLPEQAPDALTAQLEAFLRMGPLSCQSFLGPREALGGELPIATAGDGLAAIEIADVIRAAISRSSTVHDSEWTGVIK